MMKMKKVNILKRGKRRLWKLAYPAVCLIILVTLAITMAVPVNMAVPVSAAIAYGSSTTGNNGSHVADHGSLKIVKPASTGSGDFLIAGITVAGGTTATITPPDGWTLILRTDHSASVGIGTYYKIAGDNEPSSYTWLIYNSVYEPRAVGGIARYTGVDTVNPLDVWLGNDGTDVFYDAPSVTTNYANDQVLAFFGADTDFSMITPSGMTERYDTHNPNGPATALDDVLQVAAGPSGIKENGAEMCGWVAQTIALKRSTADPIAFGSFATAYNGNHPPSALTLDRPASAEPGDFLIAGITVTFPVDNSVIDIAPPDGWTLILRTDSTFTGTGEHNEAIATYYKFAGNGEPSSYTWSIKNTISGVDQGSFHTYAVGGITRYTGVDSSSPVDISLGNQGQSTSPTAPSVTTSDVNEWVLAFFGVEWALNFDTPSGMTERYDDVNPPDTPAPIYYYGTGIALDDVLQEEAGASGDKISGITGAFRWVAQTVALRPAATTNVGDGTSPSDKYVNGSETNQAVSAFTLSTSSGTNTVTGLVVTGTNTGNVANSGVKLWQDNGSLPNEWDATDTAVGSGVSFSGSTAIFSSLGISVTTTPVQYLITYDIVASPTNGDTLTAEVTGVTAVTNQITNSDNVDATITIDTVSPTVIISKAGGQQDPTTSSPINFTVTFSEPVNGFTGENVVITGTAAGTKSVVITGSGPTYNAAVSGMTSSGTVIADIDSGSVADMAGNPNSASTSPDNTVEYIMEILDANQTSAVGSIQITSPTAIYQKLAQTFTVEGSGQFNKFLAQLTATNSSSQDVLVEIYNTSGGIPVGTAIASQTYTLNLAVGPWYWVTFNLDTPVYLEAGEQYALALDETGTGIALLFWCGSSTAGYSGGDGYNSMSGWTSLAPWDFAFQTFRTVPEPDITPPEVTSVTSSVADGTYHAGDVIPVQVAFSEDVIVTGTPQLTLETGTTDRIADYASGSGSDTLTFNYTAQAGDLSGDLDYVATDSLALNGGTIQDAASNDAVLTLPEPGAAGSLAASKDIVIDTVVLTVTINRGSSQIDPTIYPTVDYDVVFSDTVTGFAGTDVTITGTAGGTKNVSVSGSGSTYTVTVTGMTSSGTVIADIAAGVVTDAGGHPNTASASTDNNVMYYLTGEDAKQESSGSSGLFITNGLAQTFTPQTTGPFIAVAALLNSDSGGYHNLSVGIYDTSSGFPSGTPLKTMNTSRDFVGQTWITFVFNTPTPTFTAGHLYALVISGDSSVSWQAYTTSDNYPSGSALQKVGGAWSAAGYGIYDWAFRTYRILDAGPKVTNVTSSVTDGTYHAGDVIPIQVTFTDNVTVTGTPQLTLETGTTDRVVDFTSVSGSTLTFGYTVQAGDVSGDLDYKAGSLVLNGGAITDTSGTAAILTTLPAPGATGSLGANKDIVVDAFGPVIYVDKDATGGANNGTSWENAFTNLQNAMAIAISGKQIWVAEGIYYAGGGANTITLKNGVEIYGGFTGTESALADRNPDPATNGAVIDGQNK